MSEEPYLAGLDFLGDWQAASDTSDFHPGFPRLLENPGKSWIFFFKFPGPEKSWKLKFKVLESPGKISLKSTLGGLVV